LPDRWLIVSDGSTDDTDRIVAEAAEVHPFIELLRVDADADRNFGSKAAAVNAGYQKVAELPHDFIGVLDADVSFEPDYYEQVIARFNRDPKLGIAGGVLTDIVDGHPVRQLTDPNWSVSGPVQMFRRECFADIGGYLPLRGGIDAAAEVMARMKGWTVRAFEEVPALHHRQTGKENHSRLGIFFHRGLEDFRLGYHPLFFAARAVLRFREVPFVLGGMTMLGGYLWAAITGAEKKVSDEFIRFLRREQMSRLTDRLSPKRETA
jgi:glycosyltransferase involved in cell wall biosynthesis